jgi:hypothetical protein
VWDPSYDLRRLIAFPGRPRSWGVWDDGMFEVAFWELPGGRSGGDTVDVLGLSGGCLRGCLGELPAGLFWGHLGGDLGR